jgi:transposase
MHVQETLSCRCGEGVVTAEAPKAIEKGQYGPGLIAHVVTSKCLDSIPLYRQAKVLSRAGVPIARTTLGDLFHSAARATEPLYQRLLELIRVEEYVTADETPQRVLAEGKTRRAYVWTFRTEKLIGYVHSHSRSGETPLELLGGTKGYLQVDGFTGYNGVILPDGRVRVGCWAHARRKFFEALSNAPEAQGVLDLILELYRVEHHASAANELGSPAHLASRKEQSAAVVDSIRDWLAAEEPKHPPKSPLGQAIRYTRGQWDALTRFLDDARLALDNNASERALRTIALGRKNYLFVGNDEAGINLAGLFSLLATCEANGINPEQYLADVLPRLASHPNARLDELLPHRWKPADSS